MMTSLKDKNLPLYRFVVQDICGKIEAGTLAVGERLPAITALCERYGVSAITVRSALKELVAGNYLESRAGSGFYVRPLQPQVPALTGDRLLAFLVPFRGSHLFFGGILAGAENEARRLGYRLVVATSDDIPTQEAEQLRELSRQVAGVMVVPTVIEGNYDAYSTLLARGVPFVFVDRYVRGLAAPLIATDNEKGGYLATRHLIEAGGVRRIYVVGERPATSLEERIRGYRRALKEADIAFDPALVREGPRQDEASGYELTHDLLANVPRNEPFGIFALHDGIARGSHIALGEAGLSVPQDVRLVGFDDTYALYLDPPMTSVRQNTEEMGMSAVRLVARLIQQRIGGANAGCIAPRNILVTPELIVRGSSDPSATFSAAAQFAIGDKVSGLPYRQKETA